MNKSSFKIQSIYILIALSFFSCNSNNEGVSFSEFNNKIKLTGKRYPCSQITSMRGIIGISDSLLIVSNYKEDSVYYLLNKQNFKVIKKAIKRGRGPGEIQSSTGSFLNSKTDLLMVVSLAKNKIVGFPVKSLIKGHTSLQSEFMKLPDNITSIDQAEIINDSLVCLSAEYYYGILINKKGNIVREIGELPSKPQGIKAVHHSNMYTRQFNYNAEKQQITFCFSHLDKVISFDLHGNKVFEKIGPDQLKVDFKNQYRSNQKKAYTAIKSESNYIYCLYSGMNDYEVLTDATTLNNIRVNYPKYIHVFDYKGQPKLKIELEHECRDFIIDKETNRLITLSPKENTFYVYDFNEIKASLNT